VGSKYQTEYQERIRKKQDKKLRTFLQDLLL
jgi:hypothetical protein